MQQHFSGDASAAVKRRMLAQHAQNALRGESSMKQYQMLVAAVMLGLGLAVTTNVSAQATATPPTGMNNQKAPDNNMKATAPNTSFSGWMTDYSKAHDGRISRQAYMDEAGKRWDSTDKSNQGLTSEQINGMYGSGSAGSNNSINKDNKGK
jgi:hypothetical protein